LSIDEREAGPVVERFPEAAAGEVPGQAEGPRHVVPPRPVEEGERVASVDVLRGVALLGILAMNIVAFAWPESVYEIPVMAPGAGAVDSALWAFNHVVFDMKMVTLFSMLFGGGLVLMADRAGRRGARLRGVYYRRVAWLLVIGLAHAYLVWDGDILVDYALCGFLLYFFRNLRPRTLIVTGLLFNLVLVPVLLGFRFVGVPYMRSTYERVETQSKQGKAPGWWDEAVHDGWKEMSRSEPLKREEFLKKVEAHRGGYRAIVVDRAKSLVWEQTLGFVFLTWWFGGGRMLIGMGLLKLGVFGAGLSRRTYWRMMLFGYGIGVPLMVFDSAHQIAHGFFLDRQLWYTLDGWPLIHMYGSLVVVFGHIGAVMLVCQSGAVPWLTRRLAAVGRTALSNYLATSLVFTTIFYGYGLDFFGTIHRPLLYAMVLATWSVQLLISPIWLEYFRFGPAEWVWRSLTYWRLQPVLATEHRPA
jgi:uncharacterized protein